MSRTVHHIRYTHRDGNCANHDCAHTRYVLPQSHRWIGRQAARCDFAGPDHTLTDLRYSTAVLSVAAASGARPIPELVTATLPLHRHMARSWQLSTMGPAARDQSRADRRQTAPTLRAASKDVNAFLRAGDILADWDEDDAIVVEPTRHHRNVRADFGW